MLWQSWDACGAEKYLEGNDKMGVVWETSWLENVAMTVGVDACNSHVTLTDSAASAAVNDRNEPTTATIEVEIVAIKQLIWVIIFISGFA